MIGYDEFRTGMSFAQVRELLAHEQRRAKDRGDYMFVSRATVLGRWSQLKREMWARFERESGVCSE
jgi:hypothetical protein